MSEIKCEMYIRDEDGGEYCGKTPTRLLEVRNDGETIAETKNFCDHCWQLVKEKVDERIQAAQNSITVNAVGERIKQEYKYDPQRKIGCDNYSGIAIHHHCGREVHRRKVTPKLSVLYCECGLRLYVPLSVETWEQLAAYFKTLHAINEGRE